MLRSLKQAMANHQLYMTGRFVDWEYYNMDAAIFAAMQTVDLITQKN